MSTCGEWRNRVTLQGPGTNTQNSEGEWVPGFVPLVPATWWCAIMPATVRDLERMTAGTTVSQATFILEGKYHAGITTQTQITKDDGRVFYVNGVQNPEERNIVTRAFCSELAP
jgi:SPP1 family predicted phage head-tail adaptor